MSRVSASVTIIIVNWNAGLLLADCVRSVLAAETPVIRVDAVVVVDNASVDGSLERLADLGAKVKVIRNASNRGFAAACNQGAAGSQSDFLLFLNPDTRLASDSLSAPAGLLLARGHEHMGICGIRMVDDRGETMPSNRRFPTLRTTIGEVTRLSRVWPTVFPPLLLDPIPGGEPVVVEQLIGAFLFIRRTVFERLKGFDERFFVYYEEVDLLYRACEMGVRSVYLPSASAFHHGGYSSDQVKSLRLFYGLRSRQLYAARHWSVWATAALATLTVGVELPARLIRAAARLSPAEAGATIGAYARLTLWALSAGRLG